MYQLTETKSIIRLLDNASIPRHEANADYQEYLKWVEKGNTPKPVDVPTPEQIAAQAIERLKAELEAMEQKALMPRGAREAFIALCLQQGVAAGLNATQLYAANPFFRGLKDADAIAANLRAQIKALT
jgi:hypothetical protein